MADFWTEPLFMDRKFADEETSFSLSKTEDSIVVIGATLELSEATNSRWLSNEADEDILEIRAESTELRPFINSKSRYICISSIDVL